MTIELIKIVDIINITGITKEELQKILDRANENNYVIHVRNFDEKL